MAKISTYSNREGACVRSPVATVSAPGNLVNRGWPYNAIWERKDGRRWIGVDGVSFRAGCGIRNILPPPFPGFS